jgi:phospholipid transport system substrate-binding protein
MFFDALSRHLGTYRNPPPRIRYSPPRRRGPTEVDVTARIQPATGYPMRIVFRFYRGSSGWKVFDVVANGQSAALYYQKYFRNLARGLGPAVLIQ